jgi:hypothetical protein
MNVATIIRKGGMSKRKKEKKGKPRESYISKSYRTDAWGKEKEEVARIGT